MNATAGPHLESLADEAVTIIREVATECENPVLLFSGGKDSAVLLHLAVLAFAPARLPFPVMRAPSSSARSMVSCSASGWSGAVISTSGSRISSTIACEPSRVEMSANARSA